ncbi:AP3-complex subunit beta-A isoform X2 [Apium graveolens]|uniref:AP3-complex subunit beta-A isoform X2 n=1 Tax=Apium graveolens TaxID=4045 RepID=UPI003D7A9CE2
MFHQFGATADSLSKASTIMFRIGTDAHLYDDPDDVSIPPLLDSKFDTEKCEALKRLLALIAQGFDVSNYFPQVVKNVASQSLEVKKLVYLYLLHYAEKRPNEALLSINYFQKDLGDPNPLVRAWALRTMAGIRLHDVAPIVVVAVGKCARDPSVYVRKCAANALPKLHDLRLEENAGGIEEIIGILLNDNSPSVVGAAAAAFASVCPNNLNLIGRYYKKLCETLPDVEEWGQIVLIEILLRYVIARHGLVRESIMACPFSKYCNSERDGLDADLVVKEDTNVVGSGEYQSKLLEIASKSYLEGSEKYLSYISYEDKGTFQSGFPKFTSAKNDDVKILLQCTSPLLWSQNSAVILAAAGLHWIMAPKEDLRRIVKPLLFILRSSGASAYVVLCNIQVFAKAMPSLFVSYSEDFFICSSDTYQIKALKLEILSNIATESSISVIFQEFQDYVRDSDRRFAADTVAAIGLCAQRLPNVANTCLEGLLALARPKSLNIETDSPGGDSIVLIQAIISIRSIIKLDPPRHEKVIVHLMRALDSIKVPTARAMIINMIGEYNSSGQLLPKMLTTVLKYLACCFPKEALETKLQILYAAVKVVLCAKGDDLCTLRKLLSYVLELAKCDRNYDVRDRARVMKKLLSQYICSFELVEEAQCVSDIENMSCLLAERFFLEKPKSMSTEPNNYRFYLPGSLSQIVLHAAPGYNPLPEPCSLTIDDSSYGSNIMKGGIPSDSYGVDDSERASGSSSDNSNSSDGSQVSEAGSSGSDVGDESGSASEGDENTGLLINFSDVGNTAYAQHNGNSQVTDSQSRPNDFGELMSNRALESWLDESPDSSQNAPETSSFQNSSARISIGAISGKVKPKSYALLDTVNGSGLRVDYVFSSEVSSKPSFVCLEVSFKNCSTEPKDKILLFDENTEGSQNNSEQASRKNESGDVKTLVPMEEIPYLEPGQSTTKIMEVHFHHHLLPIKLVLRCSGLKLPVKLWPDIGYFVKPLPMDDKEFFMKESQLRGMFEYNRRCTFIDHVKELKDDKGEISLVKDKFLVVCETLGLKMLSNANLSLVSVDMPVTTNHDDVSGLCSRFTCELLSNAMPCLITVTLEGHCSEPLSATVKVNCEETVFGLNLLNRIVSFLAEPPPLSS